MMRRNRLLRISLGDVPKGAGRRIPEAKHPEQVHYDPKLAKPQETPQLLGDLGAAVFKRREPLFTPGAAPRRFYVNKATAWFFQEIDKGVRSPWCVGLYLVMAFLAARKVFGLSSGYVWEERDYRATMGTDNTSSSINFTQSHNMAVGITNKSSKAADTATIFDSSIATPIEELSEHQAPRLVHTERSEATVSKTGEPADMVVIERREYNKSTMRDSVYRMVQYIYDDDVQETADDAKALKKADRDVAKFEKKKAEWLNSLSMARRQERARPDHVHAMVRCKGIDSAKNCVPEPGDAQSESVRKILLAMGPTHVLRDPAKLNRRDRFTAEKEIDTNILLLGMRGAEIPNALRQFNNFKFDIVEKDPSMVRIARTMLGFKETTGTSVTVGDPLYFIRRHAAEPKRKRYDLVIVDALDGKGRLAPDFSRLEFIEGIRNSMAQAGVVAVNIPNDDAQYYYHCLQNWRIAFDNRMMILAHCQTTQNTILMAFQDDASRGKPIMGSCGAPHEFAELVKAFITFYPRDKDVRFDLLKEIDPLFFRIVNAGDRLPLQNSLPPNHPALRDPKYLEKIAGGGVSAAAAFADGASVYERGTVSSVRYTAAPKDGTKEY